MGKEECDLGQGQVCGGGVVVTARRSILNPPPSRPSALRAPPPFAPGRRAPGERTQPRTPNPDPAPHPAPPYPNTTSSVPAPCAWAGVPWRLFGTGGRSRTLRRLQVAHCIQMLIQGGVGGTAKKELIELVTKISHPASSSAAPTNMVFTTLVSSVACARTTHRC